MKKNLLVYAFIVGTFLALIAVILQKGEDLRPQKDKPIGTEISTTAPTVANQTVWEQFSHNLKSPLSMLLLQIVVILAVSRLFGVIFIKLGQPSVIGEIIAGIFLGPSIMGLVFPEFVTFLFPKDSLKSLQFLSQIGLAFFMFIVGTELDIQKLKHKADNALVISHASIAFPFFLGVGLSYFIFEQFAPAGVLFLTFALFMGIAMSITAFPVLARIIQERGLSKEPIGALAISCAAADDVTAWCLLAMVIAIVKAGSIVSAVITVLLSVGFVLFMLYVIRPWLRKIIEHPKNDASLTKTTVAIIFFVLLSSAYVAEVIGIHALFGAFLAGVIMPQNLKFKESIVEKVQDLSVLVLLPIFFAFTGLRTQIGLLNEEHLWITCSAVIFVAVLGKIGGSAVSARLVGQSLKDSLSIGALMNTRGLMELVVLSIGYDLGILTPEIFAIMVIMALATTFMTGPLLDLIEFQSKKKEKVAIV